MSKHNTIIFRIISIICFFVLISLPYYASHYQAEAPSYSVSPPPASTPPKKTEALQYIADETNEMGTTDKPEFDAFTVEERIAKGLPTALPKIAPYYGDKVIYLTFDDGPSENTPVILDILKAYGVKGTFFVVGTEVEKHPDYLLRIFNEGHAIGNHSYNHIYRELYPNVDAYLEQLHHTDSIIKSIIKVRPRISRAPGGSSGHFTKTYWKRLKEEGYIEVGWNIVTSDAFAAKADAQISNITHQMKNDYVWSHGILLMHDGRGHEETVKALPAIIQFYKDRGFEFRVINSQTPPAW